MSLGDSLIPCSSPNSRVFRDGGTLYHSVFAISLNFPSKMIQLCTLMSKLGHFRMFDSCNNNDKNISTNF